LKRAYADGTVAVEMDPLSLLCRLATSVPPPRFTRSNTRGSWRPRSTWRSRVAPTPPKAPVETADAGDAVSAPKRPDTYRPWAELLKRTFSVDVLECPTCKGRIKRIAMVTERESITRYLANIGELTNVPDRSPSRGPPYWKSTLLRCKALGDAA
jgi:hypothetical protein